VFQWAMATETTLSELSTGSRPTSSTPPLSSTSHLKNMRFLCSTLYIDVITSLVSLVYWGFRGEKVTSQGDALLGSDA
jgi:hypothetical protein